MKKIVETNPTAKIAVNKSRIKMYDKNSTTPTYYLKSEQEFQIEFFNPTKDTVLAKLTLNNKKISQGGLVLRPGERVFLDRYLDVDKKFKFDTYEVSNTEEVKKAIEDNGDFKVEFYKEVVNIPYYNPPVMIEINPYPTQWGGSFGGNNTGDYYNQNIGTTTSTSNLGSTLGLTSFNSSEPYNSNTKSIDINNKSRTRRKVKLDSIETGRVGHGSTSNQKLQTLDIKFEYLPFHIVRYKILPVSQKINTVDDIKVRYCTNCGAKAGKTDKFCRQCGNKH